MPMSWTPDNDRKLLIKLLETHAISIDHKKISAAWSTNPNEEGPTAKAISERIAKIKKLTGSTSGANTPVRSRVTSIKTPRYATPSKPRAIATKAAKPTTPSASGKKRKTKIDGEDDADDHLTPSEDESPTKARKTGAARTPKSTQWGKGIMLGDDDADGKGVATPTPVRIKKEPIDNPMQSSPLPFQPSRIATASFDEQFDRARQLSKQNAASAYGYDFRDLGSGHDSHGTANTGMDGVNESFYSSYGGLQGGGIITGMDINMNMNNRVGNFGVGLDMSLPSTNALNYGTGHNNQYDVHMLHDPTSRLAVHSSPNKGLDIPRQQNELYSDARTASPNVFKTNKKPKTPLSLDPRQLSGKTHHSAQQPRTYTPNYTPEPEPEPRKRSAREASQRANENRARYLQNLREAGEKESDEDSQGSQFEDEI